MLNLSRKVNNTGSNCLGEKEKKSGKDCLDLPSVIFSSLVSWYIFRRVGFSSFTVSTILTKNIGTTLKIVNTLFNPPSSFNVASFCYLPSTCDFLIPFLPKFYARFHLPTFPYTSFTFRKFYH